MQRKWSKREWNVRIANHVSLRSRWMRKPINSGLYRVWLMERGSLTRRLQLASRTFEVEPVQVHHGRALPEEAHSLNFKPRQRAIIREVYLHCNGMPAVFAHSVLPYSSLHGDWQSLRGLGSRPLGAALFSDPRVMRTPLTFKKLGARHALYGKAVQHIEEAPSELWARRSVFHLARSAILVTEIFLPEVLKL